MSFFFSKLNSRERPVDGLARLRYALETMPSAKKYQFTSATRTEVLNELYNAFWGPYSSYFLPTAKDPAVPLDNLLSELQRQTSFGGNGKDGDPVVPGRVCGRVFQKGEACYRCKDCALDESCVLCSRCFHATDHTGHNVTLYLSQQPGGCCDCGDAEAWRTAIGCPYHPLGSSNSLPAKATARTLENWTPKVHNPHRLNIPTELRDSMSRTIAYALDFILDTLDYSPDEAKPPRNEQELKEQPTADPLPMQIFAIAVWNDEKHSFEDVAQIICDTTKMSKEQAMQCAEVIDEQGRDVVKIETDVQQLLTTASLINQIDLGVTARRVHDYFREQIVAVVVEWLLDLTQSRLMSDNIVIREIIGSELLAQRKKDSSSLTTSPEASKVYAEIKDPARMDWLFLYHTRLWKKPRLSLKQVYLSVLTLSHEHKLAVATHFANVYHRIIDSYLLVDREPENSIKYFALRLFTVPSIAHHIVRHHNVVFRLLDIITSFFTNQISQKRMIFPPAPKGIVDIESPPFKSKRFMPVFSDLRFICSNDSVQTLIAQNPEFIIAFIKLCHLFMGINPNKRAATAHVEYETEAWISVFNVTVSLSRVVKVFGEAFAKGSPGDLLSSIARVMHSILTVCTLMDDRLDRAKYQPINFHDVTFNNTTFEVVDFDVASGWISFHHSLHWLLAELFKHIDLLTPEYLMPLVGGSGTLRDIVKHFGEKAVLTMIDFPMRVIVMIAQIRSGLWVRNGFAVRGQLLHYRDFMLRELCFDQDLFLIQASFVILDANIIIVSIMDRFQLVGWFSGKHAHSLYDTPQTFSMVEEFLYVLITCMSETGNARKLTLQDNIRRELIHALASGPCVFTDILKRLAERMVDDVHFEGILNEVANFKSPESTSDSGLYELKDELYDEVDPFFHHFNRNKREEVSSILRDRIKKKTGVSDPVLIPKALGVQGGPFAAVSSALLSESLLRIVYHSIANVIRQTDLAGAIPASADAILDQALYLAMLGVVEHNREFADIGCQHVCHESLTLLDILSAFEDHSKFKAYAARVGWVLDRFADHHREAVQAVRRSKEGNAAGALAAEDARRNAAKARQKAILKDFAAAQQSFLENLEDGDADDEQNEHSSVPSMGTCIFCQEELEDSRPFGSLALIQPSRFIKAFPDNRWDALSYVLGTDPETIDVNVPCECGDGALNNPFSSSSDATTFGMHTSLCGHMMHLDCFTVYLSSIRQRHRGQAQRNHPESISRKEFICPLCKSLGNCVLPAIRPPQNPTVNPQTFIEWIRGNGITLLRSPPDRLLEFLQVKSGYGSFTFWGAQDSHYPSFVKSVVDDQHKMIDTVIGAARAISLQSRHLRDRIEPDTGDRGAGAYLPEDLVGYTIKCIEISQRGAKAGQASLINVSEQSLRTIRGLLAVMAKMAVLQFQTRPDQGQDAIRQAIIKRLLPEWKREPAYQLPLLLREPVTLLVEVAAIAPDMLPQAIIVLYYANLARVTIAILTSLSKSFTSWNHDVDVLPAVGSVGLLGDVKSFVSMIARHSPLLDLASQMALRNLGPDRLERLIFSFSLPFLRCSALLQEAALPGISNFQKSNCNSYVSLLQAMGIPNPSNILLYETLQNLLSGWCTHYGFFHSHSPQHHMILPEHPGVYKLTPLPEVLDTIFSAESPILRCRRCNTSPVEAGICLICGITVCMQSHCCREMDYRERGECNMHTRECGGVVGIYFSVKRCAILYLYANNGAFQSAPYMDVHGETDICLKRGRRQFINKLRLEEIRKVWVSHGIPTLIARKLESTVDCGGWETL